MAESGVAHKVISVILRLSELASAIIVLGILSRICYLVGIAGANVDGRIIYTIVVACLGIMYSVIFCAPFKSLFLGFPFDFVLFVMWLIAYCLLQTVLYPLRVQLSFDESSLLTMYKLTIHRKQVPTLALHVGITTTGVTIGVVTIPMDPLELSLSIARAVPRGERYWHSRSLPGFSIF
jgi:hypothetical protein